MNMDRDIKEISFGEFISITGGVLSGSLLVLFTDRLFLIPGLLILLPGFLEMRGSISGSLVSRISTNLHLGKIKVTGRNNPLVAKNIVATFILAIMVSSVLGVFAYLVTLLIFNINYPVIIAISMLAAIISNTIMIPLSTTTSIWLYKKDYDPDNIMGPYITSIGDIISILSLLLVIAVMA